jgi:phospholipid/cholesterol/gamma-HCH transport system substrate-binding protein
MEVTRSTEIKVGIVSLLAILLLVGGIMIGRGVNLSVNKQVINVALPTSGGLDNGSPVVVNGVKRGMVVDVRNDGNGVVAAVEIDRIDDLHADATARVTILEITGGKKVEIFPGSSGRFDASQPMKGIVAPDITDLVIGIGDVSGDAKSLIRRLDTVLASLTAMLADSTVVRDVRTLASNGAELVTDMKSFFRENRASLDETVASLRSLSAEVRTAVKNNEPKLTQLLDKLDRTADDAAATLKRADGAIIKADTLLLAATDVLTAIRDNDGTVHRLIYDSTFVTRLDTTMRSLDAFVRMVRKHGVNVNIGVGHRP